MRTSSGINKVPPARSKRIPVGTMKSMPSIASWPALSPTNTSKSYTSEPSNVILIFVCPTVLYAFSPIPKHSLSLDFVDHAPYLTIKGGVDDCHFSTGIKQHSGILIIDLANRFRLLPLIFRCVVFPIPTWFPWCKFKLHLQSWSGLFNNSFLTWNRGDTSQIFTFIRDLLGPTVNLLILQFYLNECIYAEPRMLGSYQIPSWRAS